MNYGSDLEGVSLDAPNGALSDLVWRMKYAAPGESSVCDTLRRAARAAASVEAKPQEWEQSFLSILDGLSFVPGGRILAGAGIDPAACLCNCFVLDTVEDTDAGVLASFDETISTLVAGGGVGADFSTLSSDGTLRKGGLPAPGPIAFMQLWQAGAEAFLANAQRRGAMMATLRCDHPDIEAFIVAKKTSGALFLFNLSVQITDSFMSAVEADQDWPLVFGDKVIRTVRARDLWGSIARAAYDVGEPGLLFVDQVNRENNLWWREKITAANPCGEAPLPPRGVCMLGSLNLVKFVSDAFAPGARMDMEGLQATARTAVRFLDNMLDLTSFPTKGQAQEARATRRIGLGIMGLADALAMLGYRYGDEASLRTAGQVMAAIRDAAYGASIRLAEEKGSFPALDREKYLSGDFIKRLPSELRAGIAAHGIRNSHLLAIAPTGSISLLAGCVSSGMEPIFAAVQARTIRDGAGDTQRFEIIDPALAQWRVQSVSHEEEPPQYVTAWDLPLSAHIDMQAALQPFVDQAISKTWNIRPDCTFEAFEQALRTASTRQLKGFAVFRPGAVREGVLSPVSREACSTGAAPCA